MTDRLTEVQMDEALSLARVVQWGSVLVEAKLARALLQLFRERPFPPDWVAISSADLSALREKLEESERARAKRVFCEQEDEGCGDCIECLNCAIDARDHELASTQARVKGLETEIARTLNLHAGLMSVREENRLRALLSPPKKEQG